MFWLNLHNRIKTCPERAMLVLVLMLHMTLPVLMATVRSTAAKMEFKTSGVNLVGTWSREGLNVSGVSGNARHRLSVGGNAQIDSDLNVGVNSYGSNLNVTGSISESYVTISENTSLDSHSVYFANSESGNLYLSLPYAGNALGRRIEVTKTHKAHSVFLKGDYISGETYQKLPQGSLASMTLRSNGLEWYATQVHGGESVHSHSDNLIAWWRLDETSGNSLIDSTGRGHTGTAIGSSYDIGAAGKIYKSFRTFNVADHILVQGHADFRGLEQFTVNGWFYVEQMNAADRLMDHPSFWIQVESATKLYFVVKPLGENASWRSVSVPAAQQWFLFTGTYESGIQKTYINGLLKDTRTLLATSLDTAAGNLIINNKSDLTKSLKGYSDDVRIYNRALTAAEISEYYSNTSNYH